ncbi:MULTISPECIES: spore coat protein YsxE [unclassified Bacillus (in: firmicutes)]|uniref:spore coat protein YsxE n=1 Tax=unclassified Bacillus (in: firmicutes) TaxID=185979 RepID=UPI0008E647F1|nr:MULTISPECIES: spore coat protein YsxE [unclassified Bacillus (in: firmicutes)]SFB16434.1 spore coat protein YsxE [Bacillus sp. UNCCL13]SFQ78041.1 spore coat protein YsxE [Bacillus sp. cl95]
MSDSNRLNVVSPILENYSIEPYFVEEVGRVKKIYSNKGTFALKKIAPNVGTDFIRHVHFLFQKGFNRIVPIYPTLDGRYAVLHEKELYYLMPWLSNEEKENRHERHQQLFRELARLHTLSAKEVPIKKEERSEHYEQTVQLWEKDQEFLDGFMDDCEKRAYMSPFDLLFCLYYHEISQAARFSKARLDEWHEVTKEQEKARMVVNHGKVSTEHFLYDDKGYGYFTNFENASHGSPIHDLLPFLARTLKTNPKKNEDCVEWIYTYFKYFPFKKDEKQLFLSYLAYPTPIIRTAQAYFQRQSPKNELKFVQQLQRQYWYLKNTEFVVMRIIEVEKSMEQSKEGAQQ